MRLVQRVRGEVEYHRNTSKEKQDILRQELLGEVTALALKYGTVLEVFEEEYEEILHRALTGFIGLRIQINVLEK